MRMFFLSIFLASAAAIGYEIVGATTLTQLLGGSVTYFSLTIGVFLAALGAGSWLSSKIEADKIYLRLIQAELVLCFLGGNLSFFYYLAYAGGINVIKASEFDNFYNFVISFGLMEIAFYLFVFGLLFVVGTLVGIELPLFSRILASKEKLSNALSKAFFWDYFGALAISVLLPLTFFSYFGILRTSFFLGLLNAAAAAILFYVYKKEGFGGIGEKTIIFLAAILAAVLFYGVAATLQADRLENFLERKIFSPNNVILLRQSPYQKIVLARSLEGKLMLFLNNQMQFEEGLSEADYHESLVHPALSIAPSKERVLILGGGDGLALREILKYQQVKSVVLVDIDKEMTEISKNFGPMKEINNESFFDPRVNVINDDAFKFLERNNQSYDAVIIDFPDPADEGLSRLYSKEFYLLLKKMLANDGVAAIQSFGYLTPLHQTIAKTAKSGGLNALLYRNSKQQCDKQSLADLFNDFGFTLVSSKEIKIADFFGVKPEVPTRVLKDKNLAELFYYCPRQTGIIDDLKLKTNTIFRPLAFNEAGDTFLSFYATVVPFDWFSNQIEKFSWNDVLKLERRE